MTDTNKTIDDLFSDDKTVSAIRMVDYLRWVTDSDLASPNRQKLKKVLAMPPIQRGFIWKPYQIQDLWDSLLRGMPIGSFLVKSFHQGEFGSSINPNGRKVSNLDKSGFHLVDGQQRTLAMALGFPNSTNPKHKLWVDFSESGKDGSKFQFRITTEAQPFGYKPNGKGRLSMHDRKEARNAWNGTDKNKNKMSNKDIFDASAKPWKMGGSKHNYFFEVKYLWQWLNDYDQNINVWLQKVKAEINDGSVSDKSLEKRVFEFGKALKKLQNQWLALIKIPDDQIKNDTELEVPGHDYLTMLFDRISSNGTRLSPDDLLFSMIKQSWPEAHNLVYEINNKVGALMKPTDFVMTAYRLASLEEEGIADNPQPNAQSFHKNLTKLLGNEKQPGKLKELIGNSDGNSPLVNAFERMKSVLLYLGNNDNGIPKAMFPYLDIPLQQVILYWLLNEKFQVNDRQIIISFVLYWMLCNKGAASKYEGSKKSIDILSKSNNQFPIVDLYKELSINNAGNKPPLFCHLVHSPSFELNTSMYREAHERAEHFFGTEGGELYQHFSRRKELLIWFQRNWISIKFEDFDPLAGQDEDNVPYDFDHFVPQSNWSSFQGIGLPNLETTGIFNNLWHRRSLGDSIGNYRVMSAPENRSRSDTSLEQELTEARHEEEELAESGAKYNESNAIDYAKDYAFDPNEYELEQWKKSSPTDNSCSWDDKRVLAFQYAVESRVLYLYKRYYDEAGFKSWLQD